MRRLCPRRFMPMLFVAAALPSLAANGPIRLLQGWGEVIDPDKDCQISAEGDRLTIKVPGTPHDLSAELDRLNAPRVIREVKGDFIAQVKVGGTVKPTGDSKIEGRTPFNGAGILLWADAKNYVRLERAALTRGEELRHYMNFELRKNGDMADIPALDQARDIPDQATYLRLERRGGQLIASTSQDGLQWQSWAPMTDEFPKELKIGVDAINSATGPFTAEFSNFQVFQHSTEAVNKPGEPVKTETKTAADGSAGFEGAWRLVGRKLANEDEFRKDPWVQIKIVAKGHFIWVVSHPETGKIEGAAGGTYTINKGLFIEKVSYATSDFHLELIGRELKFSARLDGDTWRHVAEPPILVNVNEIWERVK